MREYVDEMCQQAFEDGVKDALDEREPWEPDASDREWFDTVGVHDHEHITTAERDDMQRGEVADALDQQWNGPR